MEFRKLILKLRAKCQEYQSQFEEQGGRKYFKVTINYNFRILGQELTKRPWNLKLKNLT